MRPWYQFIEAFILINTEKYPPLSTKGLVWTNNNRFWRSRTIKLTCSTPYTALMYLHLPILVQRNRLLTNGAFIYANRAVLLVIPQAGGLVHFRDSHTDLGAVLNQFQSPAGAGFHTGQLIADNASCKIRVDIRSPCQLRIIAIDRPNSHGGTDFHAVTTPITGIQKLDFRQSSRWPQNRPLYRKRNIHSFSEIIGQRLHYSLETDSEH